MMKLLDSKDYCIVKKNPIPRMELAIRTILSTFERAGMIDTHIKRRLTPYNSLIPQIYGLPKIHKEGCPMRPIVCTIDSPSYQLAKFITKILAPLTGHTDTFIGNSTQFVEESKQWELDPQDLMISFDIKSLFTSVPINVVMTILMERLEADSTLGDRTALDPYQICQLTEKCLGSTYFAFQGQIYQQIQGTAMGSPLSPVIANIFMEDFETTALVTADYQPIAKVWKRYVDDTFVIWPHGREKLNAFLQHMNSLHPNISFTMEIEKDHKIAFLDVMIERENNRLKTTVYRKPTHTNLYLNFRSNHHPRIKFGIVQCLKHRAKKICSEETVETELELLSKVFVANGYPQKKVRELMNKEDKKIKRDPSVNDSEVEGKKLLLVLPYIQGLSERIARTCHQLNVRTAFTSRPTLRNLLVDVKGKPPSESRLGVVYSIPCNCGRVYIGETSRSLDVRRSEHKRAVKSMDSKNAIAVHIIENMDHQIQWEDSRVIEFEKNWYKRRVKEALWIKITTNCMNTDPGININATWKTILHTS